MIDLKSGIGEFQGQQQHGWVQTSHRAEKIFTVSGFLDSHNREHPAGS